MGNKYFLADYYLKLFDEGDLHREGDRVGTWLDVAPNSTRVFLEATLKEDPPVQAPGGPGASPEDVAAFKALQDSMLDKVADEGWHYTFTQDRQVEQNPDGSVKMGGTTTQLSVTNIPEPTLDVLREVFSAEDLWTSVGFRLKYDEASPGVYLAYNDGEGLWVAMGLVRRVLVTHMLELQAEVIALPSTNLGSLLVPALTATEFALVGPGEGDGIVIGVDNYSELSGPAKETGYDLYRWSRQIVSIEKVQSLITDEKTS